MVLEKVINQKKITNENHCTTIGTVSCGTLKYLVEVIQPTENKNKSVSYNSYTFIQEAKTWDWEIYQEEV